MDEGPITIDEQGQALLDLRRTGEHEPETMLNTCALSLVVSVRPDGRVLFGLNPWQCHWELPGGMIEDGESWREAAARELAEETGLVGLDLRWIGFATFALRDPDRVERAAVYAARIDRTSEVTLSDELVELEWIDPRSPVTDASPLDLEVARWAMAS